MSHDPDDPAEIEEIPVLNEANAPAPNEPILNRRVRRMKEKRARELLKKIRREQSGR